MNIYLIRHGQASATWQEADDPGLSVLGHQQAQITAKQLATRLEPDTRLISSPLRRARETAVPLENTLNSEVSVNQAFREIPAPVPRAQRQAWLKSIAHQTWDEQHLMVRKWRQSMLNELRKIQRPTVVFTHFMVLNAIVAALTAEDKVICFLPDNATVTTLRLQADSLQLVELGPQFKTFIN